MKLYLIEKIIKFKYLSNLVIKSNKSLSIYLLSTSPAVHKLPIGKIFRISTSFLKILLSPISRVKWNWLFLFKGNINLLSVFEYNYSLIVLRKIVKKFIVLGAFVKNFYFSAKSLKWLLFDFSMFSQDSFSLRFNSLLIILSHFFFLQVLNILLLFVNIMYLFRNIEKCPH